MGKSPFLRLEGDVIFFYLPSGKRLHNYMERSTIFFNGKIHYFDWAIFNSKLLVITRPGIPWDISTPGWKCRKLRRKKTRNSQSADGATQILHMPIGSMYGIYGDIYHPYTPNVSIYTIHGSYGMYKLAPSTPFSIFWTCLSEHDFSVIKTFMKKGSAGWSEVLKGKAVFMYNRWRNPKFQGHALWNREVFAVCHHPKKPNMQE